MQNPGHLALHLVRLKSGDVWGAAESGLYFLLPKGGSARLASAAGTCRLGPGDALILDSGANAKLTPAERSEFVFWCFSLALEHLYPLLSAGEIARLHDIAGEFRTPKWYPASAEISLECQRLLAETPSRFDLTHRSHLLKVAAAVLVSEFKDAAQARPGFATAEGHLLETFEKLSPHEILNLPVNELAAKFGCSRRHLNRLFHAHFGVSVAALRMEMRLLKAVSLLRNPAAKVINVAGACGFSHLGLFNSCFRKRFGTSPGQWRKMATAKHEPPDLLKTPPGQDFLPTTHGAGMSLAQKKAMEPTPKQAGSPANLAPA